MIRKILVCGILLIAVNVLPVSAAGFFEVVYAPKTSQTDDLDGVLNDGLSYGIMFGYETEIMTSDVFFDVELGYELSEHEVDAFDDSSYYYKNHRGVIGVRFKYGGLGYVEPYIGFGKMAYIHYEASGDLKDAGFPSFKIETLFGGFYYALGVDIFFKEKGGFIALGLDYRALEYPLEDTDDGSIEIDGGAKRLAVTFTILF
jgi:hypothetical protein